MTKKEELTNTIFNYKEWNHDDTKDFIFELLNERSIGFFAYSFDYNTRGLISFMDSIEDKTVSLKFNEFKDLLTLIRDLDVTSLRKTLYLLGEKDETELYHCAISGKIKLEFNYEGFHIVEIKEDNNLKFFIDYNEMLEIYNTFEELINFNMLFASNFPPVGKEEIFI